MRRLLTNWYACKAFMEEIEDVYRRLEAEGREPDLLQAAFPQLYRRLVQLNERDNVVHQELLTALGARLARQYPSLKEYFLDEAGKQRLKEMHTLAERLFEDEVH